MKISTRGRYALRMMLEFALHPGQCTKLSQVAKSQNISEKYLEQIVSLFVKAGYVGSVRGAQGGYFLTMEPASYTVEMILRLTEGSLSPVSCLEKDEPCPRSKCCATLSLWKQLDEAIHQVVDHVTLADLLQEQLERPDETLM